MARKPHPSTHDEQTMSRQESLRREGERTSPIDPAAPASEEKREALGQMAGERSDAVLDQLPQNSRERMRDRGADDLQAGYPGAETTSGNESNIHNPDVAGSDANPQP